MKKQDHMCTVYLALRKAQVSLQLGIFPVQIMKFQFKNVLLQLLTLTLAYSYLCLISTYPTTSCCQHVSVLYEYQISVCMFEKDIMQI